MESAVSSAPTETWIDRYTELTYLVDRPTASRLEALFGSFLPLRPRFPFRREALGQCAYLDDEIRSLGARALARPDDCVAIRLKHWTDPTRCAQPEDGPALLEIKTRRGQLVTRQRFDQIRGAGLPGGSLWTAFLGPLRPIAVTRFRRVAFEAPDESLRLTIDRDITIEPPGGPSIGLDACMVRIRPRHHRPPWLVVAMEGLPTTRASRLSLAARTLGMAWC